MTRPCLSILVPVYNQACVGLATRLQALAAAVPSLSYEIIVAEDGSTDCATVETNRAIGLLPFCIHLVRSQNVGRAAIRNFLAHEAHYPWLLFLDCDMKIPDDAFLRRYLEAEGDVVVGGIVKGGDPERWAGNLRYAYEQTSSSQRPSTQRQSRAPQEFSSASFLVSSDVMRLCPFNEHFTTYGYEDVLFGKNIFEHGFQITHIDNPVLMDDYESNFRYLSKTEEACRTLHRFQTELRGYSRLLSMADCLRSLRIVVPLVRLLFPLVSLPLKARLTSSRPSVFLFNIYRLLYFLHL